MRFALAADGLFLFYTFFFVFHILFLTILYN